MAQREVSVWKVYLLGESQISLDVVLECLQIRQEARLGASLEVFGAR